MKRILTVILALSMVFALTACSLRDITDKVAPTPTPAPEHSPAPTPSPTPQPAETVPTESAHPYKEILDLYYTAISEQWGISRMRESGVNYLIGYFGESMPDVVGFYVGDLDGDGLEELMIGDIGGDEFSVNTIYEFYTMADGEAIHQFSGGERSRYYMLDNGLFYNKGSNSAFNSCFNFYKMENSAFLFEEAVMFDSEMSEETDWFYTASYDYYTNPEKLKPVTADEATAFLDEREGHVTRPDYIPFAQYPVFEW